jgi:putative Mg2+ transporter-C (MgtC) family protein
MDSLLRVFLRMTLAALLGGLVGLEREMTGKAAGLRTHMLVSLGAAMFVLTPLEVGMGVGDLSRVIQGVVTGVGFLGAGAILKRDEEGKIHGLTTAASGSRCSPSASRWPSCSSWAGWSGT